MNKNLLLMIAVAAGAYFLFSRSAQANVITLRKPDGTVEVYDRNGNYLYTQGLEIGYPLGSINN
jgi:hypothetical protein